MKLNRVRMLVAAAVGLSVAAGPVAAQALDAPLVNAMQSKPSSVRLMVIAGASGAPAGFEVQWITKAEFDLLGGFPADGVASTLVEGTFDGTPTFNIEGSADSYILGPAEGIEVELGQLFDETGVSDVTLEEAVELEPGTQYVVRVRTQGAGAGAPSDYTDAMIVNSAPLAANCTYTQGFWKNHFELWPVTSLTLGTVNYTAAELLAIFNQPAGGNKLIILAHQLIAAKLNLANGADPSASAATIAAADAIIGALVVPPIGGDDLPNNPAVDYANLLDDYNNGLIGPGHCGTVPASAATWGQVKSLYRQ